MKIHVEFYADTFRQGNIEVSDDMKRFTISERGDWLKQELQRLFPLTKIQIIRAKILKQSK